MVSRGERLESNRRPEQVTLFENDKVLTKFTALCGQWLREKEDLLMRDLYSSSVSYINCTGGINGQQPSEISRNDVNNIERILLGNDARTMLEVIEAELRFAKMCGEVKSWVIDLEFLAA